MKRLGVYDGFLVFCPACGYVPRGAANGETGPRGWAKGEEAGFGYERQGGMAREEVRYPCPMKRHRGCLICRGEETISRARYRAALRMVASIWTSGTLGTLGKTMEEVWSEQEERTLIAGCDLCDGRGAYRVRTEAEVEAWAKEFAEAWPKDAPTLAAELHERAWTGAGLPALIENAVANALLAAISGERGRES